MKAMIFAAGMGTRLRPLTDTKPKALIEVGGIPMIERVIMRLNAAGVTEIVVNVHHFSNMIVDFLQSKDNFGCNIHISDESSLLLDTGGGILNARKWLDGSEPFIVHNADIITDIDLRAMYDSHIASRADASLLVAERQTSRYLLFDEEHRLHGWINRKSGEVLPSSLSESVSKYRQLAFGGIHILSPTIFKSLAEYSDNKVFSIIPYYISECTNLRFVGYEQTAHYRWCDIGKLDTLKQAEQLFGNN